MNNDTRGDRTRSKILGTGLEMWLENPESVTANGIATRLDMSHGTILYHFPDGVKDAVANFAVAMGNVEIMAQLIAGRHPAVSELSAEDRREILSGL